ncbi:glycosyltransferase family 1 protein [bacterium]|nr:glycosyltransferase family 1 protein [bacterium]
MARERKREQGDLEPAQPAAGRRAPLERLRVYSRGLREKLRPSTLQRRFNQALQGRVDAALQGRLGPAAMRQRFGPAAMRERLGKLRGAQQRLLHQLYLPGGRAPLHERHVYVPGTKQRIAFVTDGWLPQVNGVVNTLLAVIRELEAMGHEVQVFSFDLARRKIPCPSYPEIKIAWFPFREIARALDRFDPDAVHIVSEITVGLAGRHYCLRRGIPFTTAYHTRVPEYVRARFPVPLGLSYAYFRWFHSKAERVLVTTPTMMKELEQRGFRNLVLWQRGVDTSVFYPREEVSVANPADQRPVLLYAGRVAVEKNVEAFLKLDVPGQKIVVGDGPLLEQLRERYPEVRFTGRKTAQELAEYYSYSDVFVFPSLTDTYGLVLLEALACGTPVAAYPAPGPVDVLEHGVTGCISSDLAEAVRGALKLDRQRCLDFARANPWSKVASDFLQYQYAQDSAEV